MLMLWVCSTRSKGRSNCLDLSYHLNIHVKREGLFFLEIMRVLKPAELFYLNAPSAGSFHRDPVDCRRFFPDSVKAMVFWSRRTGGSAELLGSYVQKGGTWQDYVGIFVKVKSYVSKFASRILETKTDFENGWVLDRSHILNLSKTSQNDKKIIAASQIIPEKILLA